MNAQQHDALLKSYIDNLLSHCKVAGFAGAFIIEKSGGNGDFILAHDVVPGASDEIKRYVKHQLGVLRGDLIVNSGLLPVENPAIEFVMDLFRLSTPLTCFNLTMNERQMENLYRVVMGILSHPDDRPESMPLISMAEIVANAVRPYLDPERVRKFDESAEVMRETLAAKSFGTGVLQAGLDQLNEEFLEKREEIRQRGGN